MVSAERTPGTRYLADDALEMPPLLELAAGSDVLRVAPVSPVAAGEPVRQRLEAAYFDTVDLRLATAGLTLRRRAGGEDAGWHLTGPAGKGRSAVHLPPKRGTRTRTVPGPLQRMVRARSSGQVLRPVAETVTERTLHRLADATGHVLAELADDRVTARRLYPTDGLGDAAGATTSWREVLVGPEDGDAELLSAVGARLREHGFQEAPAGSGLDGVLAVPERRDRKSAV